MVLSHRWRNRAYLSTLAGNLAVPKTLNKKQGDDFSCQAITPAGPSVATAHRGDGKRFVLRADEKV
jgi:hypothetical protein